MYIHEKLEGIKGLVEGERVGEEGWGKREG